MLVLGDVAGRTDDELWFAQAGDPPGVGPDEEERAAVSKAEDGSTQAIGGLLFGQEESQVTFSADARVPPAEVASRTTSVTAASKAVGVGRSIEKKIRSESGEGRGGAVRNETRSGRREKGKRIREILNFSPSLADEARKEGSLKRDRLTAGAARRNLVKRRGGSVSLLDRKSVV